MNRSIVTTDVLEEKLDKEFGSIFTGLLAKIESFDKKKLTAKVQPLAKIETAKGFKNLPVVTLPVKTSLGDNYHLVPNYKKGDIVILLGGLYSTVNSSKGNFEQDLSRKHALENMVIIGGLYSTKSFESDVIEDGLVICHEKSKKKIVLKKSGVEITGDVLIKGNLEVEKEITWMKKTTPTKGSTHIHGDANGSTASPKPGS